MASDSKYKVYKAKDVEEFNRKLALLEQQSGLEIPTMESLADAVVIRTRDVFASAGLRSYGAAIETYLHATHNTRQGTAGLEHASAYFEERAQEALEILVSGQAKLPD